MISQELRWNGYGKAIQQRVFQLTTQFAIDRQFIAYRARARKTRLHQYLLSRLTFRVALYILIWASCWGISAQDSASTAISITNATGKLPYSTQIGSQFEQVELAMRIDLPAARESCAKSSAHSWLAAVYWRSGELIRTQCLRFFLRMHRPASR